jgi:TATA-box binding protein (TBP) (component of TFIID and TFIIIB)
MKLSMVISLVLFVFASCGANRKDDSAATSVKSDLNTEVEIILNNSITGFVYRFNDARVPFQIFNDEKINLNGAQLVRSGAFDRGAMSSLT